MRSGLLFSEKYQESCNRELIIEYYKDLRCRQYKVLIIQVLGNSSRVAE